MLFKTKYAGLCVLGTEIFYVLCVGYGFVLTGRAMDLHHSLFELIPGFSWGNSASIVWGGCIWESSLGSAVGTLPGCIMRV